MSSKFSWAPTAFKKLNGIFCVYKPPGIPVNAVVSKLQGNLTKDLNALPCYEYELNLSGSGPIPENQSITSLSTHTQPDSMTDFSEHRLVLGPRYQKSDIRINYVDGMNSSTSGVLVMSIGGWSQRKLMRKIALAKYMRVYHVKGQLGWASDDFTSSGKQLQKSTFRHVSRYKLEKVLAAQQAAYTKQMQILSGVDPDSQEAYELAAHGIIRPAHRNTSPMLYGIRCVNFDPPNFTLEVHTINEQSYALAKLIHDSAVSLKTLAVCSGVRRLRYGHFTTYNALASPQWTLDGVVDNILLNQELITPGKLRLSRPVKRLQLGDQSQIKALPEQNLIASSLNNTDIQESQQDLVLDTSSTSPIEASRCIAASALNYCDSSALDSGQNDNLLDSDQASGPYLKSQHNSTTLTDSNDKSTTGKT